MTTIHTQNNKRNFSLPGYHLNDYYKCFIWLFNNADCYAFFIGYNALFRHRSVSDRRLLWAEIWGGGNNSGNASWMPVLAAISIWVTSIFWRPLITGNRSVNPVSVVTTGHAYCLRQSDHPKALLNLADRIFKWRSNFFWSRCIHLLWKELYTSEMLFLICFGTGTPV